MSSFLDFVRDFNPEWVTAISTIIYIGFTAWVIKEERMTRKKLEEPQIDAYFQRAYDTNSMLYLIIKNNGNGGAYNLKIKLKEEFETFKDAAFPEYKKLSFQGPIKNGISFLAPGAARELHLGMHMGDDFNELIKKTIDLTVSYQNISGNSTIRNFSLAFAELENTMLLPDDPLFTISKTLEKIAKKIDGISSGFNKIHIITQTKEEKKNEEREIIEELKKQKTL